MRTERLFGIVFVVLMMAACAVAETEGRTVDIAVSNTEDSQVVIAPRPTQAASATVIAVPEIVVEEEVPVADSRIAKRACMPVCDVVGSRSEGYYDSCTGELIRWFSCAKSGAVCMHKGTESEGWYDKATRELIMYGDCYDPITTTVQDPQAVGCVCPALYAPVCSVRGVTYSNSCVAECSGAEIDYEGKCEGYVECKYYEDEKGCRVSKCTDGSSSISCPGAYEPKCKRYLDGEGCVVKECTDGTREVTCASAPMAECERYRDDDGCVVTECGDGKTTRDCPIVVLEETECKYYFDEKGCKVKSCEDGTIEVRCPTAVTPAVPEPVPECKKIETEDGCIKKVCDNGYEAVYCPEVADEIVNVECRVYIDGEGCRVKKCADGSEHRSCPVEERKCKVYEEENGCKTRICEDGTKVEYCPDADVIVRPKKAIARIKVREEVRAEIAEGAVDLESYAVSTPVQTSTGQTEDVELSREGETVRITSRNAVATANQEVRVEQNRLRVAEKLVSILPDKALENVQRVAARMEVRSSEIKTGQERARYEVAGVERGNLLWILPVEMEVTATVDAENGEVNVARPWWSFLVSTIDTATASSDDTQPYDTYPPGSTTTACTEEAKLCSDGSYVARNPANNCEFDPCPGE